jgi:hypothetical protein
VKLPRGICRLQVALHIGGGFRVYADARVEIDNLIVIQPNILSTGIRNSTATMPLAAWSRAAPPPNSYPDSGGSNGA